MKEPKYTRPWGYFTGSNYRGRMPDGTILNFPTDEEYRRIFWEELEFES